MLRNLEVELEELEAKIDRSETELASLKERKQRLRKAIRSEYAYSEHRVSEIKRPRNGRVEQNLKIIALWQQGMTKDKIIEVLLVSRAAVEIALWREERLQMAQIDSAIDGKIRITKTVNSRAANVLREMGLRSWEEAKAFKLLDFLKRKNCGIDTAEIILKELRRRYPDYKPS